MASENPTAFMSYSWDGNSHKKWVRDLAKRLRHDGVDVSLDQWEVVPGDQIPEFMEKAIRDTQFTLIVCTPNYRQRSDSRKGGVGYEGNIMTAEVFNMANPRKFIPILRSGGWKISAPSWLKGKYYIDLSGNPYSEDNYRELVNTLLGLREVAPPVGQPNLGATIDLEAFRLDSYNRWKQLVVNEPANSSRCFPNGYCEMCFDLVDCKPADSLIVTKQRLLVAQRVNLSGWPPFADIESYPYEDFIESWAGRPRKDGLFSDPRFCDFWRASRYGRLYTIRGYVEDSIETQNRMTSFLGTIIIDEPIKNVAEGILFAARLAKQFDGAKAISTICRFTGLNGRSLVSSYFPQVRFFERNVSQADQVTLAGLLTLQQVQDDLTGAIHKILQPLYEHFDFFELTQDHVQNVLKGLKAISDFTITEV